MGRRLTAEDYCITPFFYAILSERDFYVCSNELTLFIDIGTICERVVIIILIMIGFE